MKTIYQLAKLSRRIPRVISHAAKKMSRRGIKAEEFKRHQRRIAVATMVHGQLSEFLMKRRIGLPELRNTTPHRLRTQITPA